jgi:hypothetical protein
MHSVHSVHLAATPKNHFENRRNSVYSMFTG